VEVLVPVPGAHLLDRGLPRGTEGVRREARAELGDALTAYVGVVGPAEASEAETALAVAVGRLLAEAGAVVVCGGLGGVMAAAARGAASVNARTGVARSLGILPGDDRTAADPHLDVVVATGLGEARNVVLVSASDALVAVGGSPGTLSEIALAVRAGKPVALLAAWSVHDAEGRPVDGLHSCATPAEAVAYVIGRAS
jgi:uncharacterized protein (TIGR00725 family)